MEMKKFKCVVACILLALPIGRLCAQIVQPVAVPDNAKTSKSQWAQKKVAFLGDSMTDKQRIGTTCVYWEYLSSLLHIEPFVYGINGHQWNGIYQQAQKLYSEKGDGIDAILIFAGTNDFNASIPLGRYYQEAKQEVNHNGQIVSRLHREHIMTDTTFCGRVNIALSFLKQKYPTKQIILLTPIHRSFAQFGEKNIQADESYSNACGLFIDDYVKALKEAGTVWSVPIIDLYSLSGLFPSYDSYIPYFHDAKTDRLHPNARGDYRIARTIQYQLLALPATY
jgi:lysophospholipase L1-like esterase